MKLKSEDIIVDKDDPFKNCLFEREIYANILTKVITNYNKNIVLAINSEWGTGKSTFVRMWQQKLVNDDFITVYFNAWENDFEDEPLTALLGELNSIKTTSERTFDNVLKVAKNFTTEFLPAAAKGIAKRYISEEAIDIVEGSLDGSSALVKKLLDNYSAKKIALIDFRKEIKKVIEKISPDKPLIFFVDELDRCRPDYAVSLLEKIKHFFNVPNIVFILAMDKEQLSHSVSGVYNSDKIDSQEYLRRFIDIEYSIPIGDKEKYIEYLITYYEIDNDIDRNDKNFYTSEKNDFNHLIWNLFHKYNLRRIEKILGLIKLSLISINKEKIYPDLHLVLLYLKVEEMSLYNKILEKNFSISELYKEINSLNFLKMHKIFTERNNFIAIFLSAYANYVNQSTFNDFLKNTGPEAQSIRPSLQNLASIYGQDWPDINLKTFLERINLTNDFDIN